MYWLPSNYSGLGSKKELTFINSADLKYETDILITTIFHEPHQGFKLFTSDHADEKKAFDCPMGEKCCKNGGPGPTAPQKEETSESEYLPDDSTQEKLAEKS